MFSQQLAISGRILWESPHPTSDNWFSTTTREAARSRRKQPGLLHPVQPIKAPRARALHEFGDARLGETIAPGQPVDFVAGGRSRRGRREREAAAISASWFVAACK